ncbi:hypothetical protein [Variovorax saccharolyticus]|uniref:hypothetical protein n=1 Tax=Variovorax saccharolyticus TaxID=3053516 RepID=UPI002575354D|nr:hypothetical protein [Variovorax sp. J31P216]MDM0030040.1 hypothetical protein [Variovorax sp. J31P216]
MGSFAAKPDLTRFNRAGLARVQYVDANAAVLLERLRAGLAKRFTQWPAAQADTSRDGEAVALNERLLAQYHDQRTDMRDDMLWQLTRSYARAAHVLSATLDAYANEGWIGTATQWENLRRLVAMLDYAPHPAASAYTPLALLYKPGVAGRVAPGLQLRHAPPDGSPPLVFETLEEQQGDAALNALRLAGHDRNPVAFTGNRLLLEGRHDKLKVGDPIVLEDERTGQGTAHLVQAASPSETQTEVVFAPPVRHAQAHTLGWLRVHAVPKDRLTVKAPVAHGAQVGRALQLATPADGLAAGDIVVLGRPGAKPVYRRLQRVDTAARQLVFHRPLGNVDLDRASIARPVPVPISRRDAARDTADGTGLRFLRVAGDWSRLLGLWLADIRVVEGHEHLPVYECTRAEYTPVVDGEDEREGYTIIGLAWDRDEDGVSIGGADPDLRLANPQALLAPPPGAGPWRPDTFLQQSEHGALAEPLVVASPKHTLAGDWAVLVRGTRLACARLRSLAIDSDANEARLATLDGWHDQPEGSAQPFFVTTTTLRGHFDVVARAAGWNVNGTPASGNTELRLAALPPGLRAGLPVIAANPSRAVRTVIDRVKASSGIVVLRDALPRASTVGNVCLYGNVVLAGHGETRPVRVLGNGDATRSRQRFLFDVTGTSYVADASMPAGVRADVQILVSEERWTQVGNLNDSGPTDAHYQARASEDGRLWFEFGDGTRGRRLPTGANNLRVSWRQGVGTVGNLPAGALSALVKPHALLAGFEQPLAAAGGAAREGVEAIRENAASSLLALERAVSLEDHARLMRAHAAVVQARAFAPATGLARRDKVDVYVVPAGAAPLTAELEAELLAFAAAHAAPGVDVAVHPYAPLLVGFRVVIRVRREAFDADSVAAQVRAALQAAFGIDRRALGQVLYRGEVFAVVEQVAGVENSDCLIVIDPATAAQARRVAMAAPDVVLAVLPQPMQCVHVPHVRPGQPMPHIDVRVEAFTL